MGILTCIRGGVAYMKVPTHNSNEIRTRLIFDRYDYVTKKNEKFACLSESKRGDDSTVFTVPRCFPSQCKDLVLEQYTEHSSGEVLKSIKIKEGKVLNWKGVDQQAWVSQVKEKAEQNQLGGYGLAPCGTGKTLMGLALILAMGKTALVVVSRQFQIEQWQKEARESFVDETGQPLQLGVVQAGKFQVEPQIVLIVVNSLLELEDKEFFKRFGVVIFDECHHLPCQMYLKALAKIKSQYIFGFTASFHRSDNLQGMFKLLIGDVLAEAVMPKHKEKCSVLQFILGQNFGEPSCYGEPKNRMILANKLKKNKGRNHLISKVILKLVALGRQILVFSDIKDHLRLINDFLIAQDSVLETNIGFFTGDETKIELEKALFKPITFTTYAMGNEGLNAPHKDTIVCLSPPTANLRQLKGRVERDFENKKSPLVIDFVDSYWSILMKKGTHRKWKWRSEGVIFKEVIVKEIKDAEIALDNRSGEVREALDNQNLQQAILFET